jgi:hypothetical protein
VPFSAVKRVEIIHATEGGTALTIQTLASNSWVLQTGRLANLERIGKAIARMMKLQRRDLYTWE